MDLIYFQRTGIDASFQKVEESISFGLSELST